MAARIVVWILFPGDDIPDFSYVSPDSVPAVMTPAVLMKIARLDPLRYDVYYMGCEPPSDPDIADLVLDDEDMLEFLGDASDIYLRIVEKASAPSIADEVTKKENFPESPDVLSCVADTTSAHHGTFHKHAVLCRHRASHHCAVLQSSCPLVCLICLQLLDCAAVPQVEHGSTRQPPQSMLLLEVRPLMLQATRGRRLQRCAIMCPRTVIRAGCSSPRLRG